VVSIVIPAKDEESNVEILVRSIYEQTYRPLDVIVVDGGSRDKTVDILSKMSEELNDGRFKIQVLRGQDFTEDPSPAKLKNIGVKNSSGEYIIFLDADMLMEDAMFVSKAQAGLDKNPWVGVKVEPIDSGSLVERALAAEALAWYSKSSDAGRRKYCAIKRHLTSDRLFDPNLGVYEDVDFFDCYLQDRLGIRPLFVDTMLGVHEPRTLAELFHRETWYGRTMLQYARKRSLTSQRSALLTLVERMAPGLPLIAIALASILVVARAWAWQLWCALALVSTSLFIARRIRTFARTPAEHRNVRLFLLIMFISCIFRPLAYSIGLISGFFGVLIKGGVRLSRD